MQGLCRATVKTGSSRGRLSFYGRPRGKASSLGIQLSQQISGLLLADSSVRILPVRISEIFCNCPVFVGANDNHLALRPVNAFAWASGHRPCIALYLQLSFHTEPDSCTCNSLIPGLDRDGHP